MIAHRGFDFLCDEYACQARIEVPSETERTAILHARADGWFIGRVRITAGIPVSRIRSKRVELCPMHRGLVGA